MDKTNHNCGCVTTFGFVGGLVYLKTCSDHERLKAGIPDQIKVRYQTLGGWESSAYVEDGSRQIRSGFNKHTDEPVQVVLSGPPEYIWMEI